jgi:hypothetical protein
MEDKKNKKRSVSKKPSSSVPEERPKRPLNAYFRFRADVGKKFTDEHQGQKASDVAKHISEAYKKLSEAQKSKYEQAFQKD